MVGTGMNDFGDIADRNQLSISDKVVLSKIMQLPTGDQTINPYRRAISKFFDTLSGTYGIGKNREYSEAKLRSLNSGLKELWVLEARKGETFKLFQNFESFEKILFQSNPEYRGHYIHQFDVFLLGYYILNRILESDTEVVKNLSQRLSEIQILHGCLPQRFTI